ncbi:hypothetical protein R55214_HHFBAMCI_01702 [Fructobacillus evanidus]|uniref:Uncharacterized protein n=1 Tax=Fructobacillus evanidus TaxID=3064281 RepID=A0ABN9Z0B5_9LACO|nr:hypothetical protein R55214_HHFBAMCI_01702 [Fructobacillus sp. LMG 32999]
MTKKFTEEEYQKIAEIADKTIKGIYFGSSPVRNFWNELSDSLVGEKYFLCTYGKEIFAIANPATRDWAHEQFVEKEKKYYWTTKNKDKNGNVMYLKRDPSGSIERVPHAFHGENERLTEPEVIAEGYNPDYYEKEEVE